MAGTAYSITDGTRYIRLTHQTSSAAGSLTTNSVSCHLRTNRDQNNFLINTATDSRGETTVNSSAYTNLGTAFSFVAPQNGILYYVGSTGYRKLNPNTTSETAIRLLKNSSALTQYPRYVTNNSYGVGGVAELLADVNSGQTISSQYQGRSVLSSARFSFTVQKYFLNQEPGEYAQRSLANGDNNTRDWNQIDCENFSHENTRDIEVVAVIPHKSDSANDLFEIYLNTKGTPASGYDVNSSIAKRSFSSADQNGIMIHQYLFSDVNSNDVNICLYGKSSVGKITITGGNIFGITANSDVTPTEVSDENSTISIFDLNFYQSGVLTSNVDLTNYSDVNVLFDFNAQGNAIDINSAKVFYRAPYDDQNCFGVIRQAKQCTWKEENQAGFFTGTNTDSNNYYFISSDDDDHVFKPWVYNADPDSFEAKDGNFELYGDRWIKILHTLVPAGPNYFYNFSFSATPPSGAHDLEFYDCNNDSTDPVNDNGCFFVNFGYDTPRDLDTFYSIKYQANDNNQIAIHLPVQLNTDGNHWSYMRCSSCTSNDNWKIDYISENTNIDRERNWTTTAGPSFFASTATTHNTHYHYLISNQDNYAEWYVTLDNLAGTTFTSETYREEISLANLPPTPDGFNYPIVGEFYKSTMDINWNVYDPNGDSLLCDFNILDYQSNVVYFASDVAAVDNNTLCLVNDVDISAFASGTYTLNGISKEHDTDYNFARGSTISFGIDNNYPVTTIIPDLNNQTRNSLATFSLSCADTNGSGCSLTQYNLDGGEPITYTGAVTVTGGGTHTLDYNSTDELGNSEPKKSISFFIDTNTVYVSTTSDFDGTGWLNSSQTINFTCAPADGHTCADTNYNLDNAGWTSATSITISADGNHLLQFRSTDDLNRIEGTNTIYVAIDKTQPTFNVDNNNTWFASEFNLLFLDANFDDSGKRSAQARINSGSWNDLNYSGTNYYTIINSDGNNSVDYNFTDTAGNSSTGTTYALLDITIPVTTYSGCGPGWKTSSETITFSCTDASTSCISTYNRIDLGAWATSTTLAVTTDGNHLIDYYSTDYAGNVETQKSFYCAIDQNTPVIDSILDTDTYFTHDFNVTFKQVTFGASGFGGASYRLNNGVWSNMVTNGSDYYALVNADGNNQLDYNITDLAGNSALGTVYALLDYEDTDEDGNLNTTDPLFFTEAEVEKSGLANDLNITVGGQPTTNLFSGVKDLNFYDGTQQIMNFDFNFDANTLDLSKVKITKTANAIVVDLNGQLQTDYNKTLYLTNNSFAYLCVKNSPITLVSEISSACTGANEYNFTECLTAGSYSTAGINCTLANGVIKADNLMYSGILGTQAAALTTSSGGCTPTWACTSWSECADGNKTRVCTKTNSCGTALLGKPNEQQTCISEEPLSDSCTNMNCDDGDSCTTESCDNGICVSKILSDCKITNNQADQNGQANQKEQADQNEQRDQNNKSDANIPPQNNNDSQFYEKNFTLLLGGALLLIILFLAASFTTKNKKNKLAFK